MSVLEVHPGNGQRNAQTFGVGSQCVHEGGECAQSLLKGSPGFVQEGSRELPAQSPGGHEGQPDPGANRSP